MWTEEHRSCHPEDKGWRWPAQAKRCSVILNEHRSLRRASSQRGDVTHKEPIFNIPGGVLATLAVLVAVHIALSMLSPERFEWWVLALAFIPARYAGFANQLP